MSDERRQGERRTASPAYQHYAKTWLVATAHLSLEEQGAYQRLLDHQWVDGALPTDERDRARLLGVTLIKWRRLWARLEPLFPNGLNVRLEEVRAEQQAYRDAQSANGKRGAAKVWARHGEANGQNMATPSPQNGDPYGQNMALQSSPSPTPNTGESKALVAPSATPPLAVEVVERRKPKALSVETIIENLRAVEEQTDRRATTEAQREVQAQVAFAYWAKRLGHPGALLDPKRQRVLVTRLSENRGNLSELLYAVDGALRDDWIMGRDAKSTKKYDGIETIFRDRAQVERLAQGMPGWREGKVHPMAEKYAA